MELGLATARVREVVEACGRDLVLPAFRNLAAIKIGLKAPGDWITETDVAAEAYLAERLTALLPEAGVVGEESAGGEADWCAALHAARCTWIIDPIDGTANFATGIPIFAIMVALIEKGETVAGWIHDPIAGATAVAVKGQGAWIGSRRLRTAAPDGLPHMVGTLHLVSASEDRVSQYAQATKAMAPPLEIRCAGHDYLNMATGRTHYAVFNYVKPWDHAAGVLLHEEAGGCARRLDGARYEPAGPVHGNPLVLAASETSWRWLAGLLDGAAP